MKSLLSLLLVCQTYVALAAGPELISVRKLWDQGGHNAFTDLIRFHDQWFCAFRESDAHVGGDGKIRILQSIDGDDWKPVALIMESGTDLRDPKLSITPDGRLMAVMGGSVYHGTKKLQGCQPRVAFSREGSEWSPPERVLAEGDWLWRATWRDGTVYGTVYHLASTNSARQQLELYSSTNGTEWKLFAPLKVTGKPNETTLRFLHDGEAIALIRREADDKNGWIGHSPAPYTNWNFTSAGIRLGGPDFLELPDGSLVAGSRDYSHDPAKFSLYRMTDDGLKLALTLPSGGDCSYPALVWHEDILWVSYYSSHEGKTGIYLAKVRWPLQK